jgi:hypothetical protein
MVRFQKLTRNLFLVNILLCIPCISVNITLVVSCPLSVLRSLSQESYVMKNVKLQLYILKAVKIKYKEHINIFKVSYY